MAFVPACEKEGECTVPTQSGLPTQLHMTIMHARSVTSRTMIGTEVLTGDAAVLSAVP